MSFLQRFQFNAPKSLLGGRYQIIQALGAGGFGQTFLAADLHLPGQPHCVVKQLKPQSTHPQSLQVAARLFDTEAQVLYQLGHHDQIPRLLAHFQEGSEFYLVQEWIDGTPLSEELIAEQPWTEAQVIFMLQSLLDVLAFVHQQNVIHRDIKPSNLMRRRSDHKIVLIDFGAVKQVSTALSHPHAAPTQTIGIGTPGYMPIEQIAGAPRFSSDVYAVGVVAIEALTGICPRRMNQDPNTGKLQWRDNVPHLDSAIATVLEQMICPDFRDRYATAVEALTAIQAMSAGITPPPVLPPLSPLQVQSPPTEATIAVNPAPNPAPLAGRKLPFFAPSQSTALAPDPARNTSSPPINTLKQLVPMRWRESLARDPHRLPFAIGLTVLAFVGWTATRPPQTQSAQSNAPAVSPSPNPAEQVTQLLTQAEQQQTAKQYQSALETYDKAIALDSKFAKAHWGRCYNLNHLQRSQDAIAACDVALSLRSDYPEALWSKGYALDQQQRYEQALPLYERAIALKPDFAEAWSNKGTLLLRLNRLEESIAAFDKAIALKPEIAEAWNNRGAALWSLGRVNEAVSSIEKAIQLRPDYVDALSLRQQMDQKLGRSSAQARQKQSPQKRSKAKRTVSDDDKGDDD